MQAYVDACARRPGAARVGLLLDRIIPEPALHARFVNTLARLEYLIQATEDQLRQATAHPSQTQQRAALEERIEALHRARDRFRALKQNADGLTEVLATIESAARAHERRSLGHTAPFGPTTPAPVTTPGRKVSVTDGDGGSERSARTGRIR